MIRSSVGKRDGMAACLGKPLYVEDLVPQGALRLKVLRSPHAFAEIVSIDASRALAMEGVACVLTYEDVPQSPPITLAAEAFPEGSTHDRVILERTMRYVGEPAAVVAAETEEIAQEAVRLIDVTYRLRTPVLDFETSIDNGNPLYEKEQVFTHFDNGSEPERNIIAAKKNEYGDMEEAMRGCDVVVSGSFHTQAQAHVQAETHRACCIPDEEGGLIIYSSCQAAFNTQRVIAEGLGIPMHRLRVIKPKVGGAFGGKNTMLVEGLAAAAASKTNRPCALILTREECFLTNTRHASRVDARIGAAADGTIKALDVHMLIDGGAHGEHSFDVLCVGCGNSLPIYRAGDAVRFSGQGAYTNKVPAGAFRGFGGPQTAFAIDGLISDLARRLNMDPSELRLKNIIREGDFHPFVSGGRVNSCTLDRLIHTGKEMIGWEREYPCRRVDAHTIRAVGMGVAMHGSGIGGFDSVNATVSLNYDGSFTLFTGACDLGTGADTVLLQIAAHTLNTDLERMRIVVSDTARTPYDKGAYASSTTYVTGNAVKNACELLLEKIINAAQTLYDLPEPPRIAGGKLKAADGAAVDTLEGFAHNVASTKGPAQLTATGGFNCAVSPPPYVAGFVLLQVDTQTGFVKLLDYVAVADCGCVINPALARVQVEGGCAQCMGFALYEDVKYSARGKLLNDDLRKYRIPAATDVPPIRVAFEESYESTGPYGAKSIGEVAFHTPALAIREAMLHATRCQFNSLPITPEKVLTALEEKRKAGVALPC